MPNKSPSVSSRDMILSAEEHTVFNAVDGNVSQVKEYFMNNITDAFFYTSMY